MSVASQDSSKIKIKPTSRKKKKEFDVYSAAILTKHISLPITNIGQNIKETLKNIIVNEIEGKCIAEGFIKSHSVDIITYSNGVISGYLVNFEVVIECLVCNPVEGMHLSCIVKNITKAGIRAQLYEENNPIIIFIARDHNYKSKNFSLVEVNQIIKIRIIGQRFELNDTYISVIGELLDSKLKVKQKIKVATSDKSPVIVSDNIENLTPDLSLKFDSIVKDSVASGSIPLVPTIENPTKEDLDLDAAILSALEEHEPTLAEAPLPSASPSPSEAAAKPSPTLKSPIASIVVPGPPKLDSINPTSPVKSDD
jgi:DNA-directed RNA polymerase subunit E'/Rpb7